MRKHQDSVSADVRVESHIINVGGGRFQLIRLENEAKVYQTTIIFKLSCSNLHSLMKVGTTAVFLILF